MSLTKMTSDVEIISALSDDPSADGLTTVQFKAKFDAAAAALKAYLNETLTEELDAESLAQRTAAAAAKDYTDAQTADAAAQAGRIDAPDAGTEPHVWTVASYTPATRTAAGNVRYVCAVCGEEVSTEIPALGTAPQKVLDYIDGRVDTLIGALNTALASVVGV